MKKLILLAVIQSLDWVAQMHNQNLGLWQDTQISLQKQKWVVFLFLKVNPDFL